MDAFRALAAAGLAAVFVIGMAVIRGFGAYQLFIVPRCRDRNRNRFAAVAAHAGFGTVLRAGRRRLLGIILNMMTKSGNDYGVIHLGAYCASSYCRAASCAGGSNRIVICIIAFYPTLMRIHRIFLTASGTV